MFHFIHASDLHLGKPFGQFDDGLRGRLAEARHGAIGRLADVARAQGAAHVLLAGDTFDGTFVSARVRTQALAAMSEARDLTWWILPGNHDPVAAEPLWDAVRRDAGPGLRVLDAAVPVDMAPGVTLLPAPVTHRATGRDLTAWMDEAPGDGLRIGLAHGGVIAFGSDTESGEVIPPDRAAQARLDYLALGDWHGQRPAGVRAWYSGTPERDSFRHAGPGAALAVTLEPGAPPRVAPVPVGTFDWQAPELVLTPQMDAVATVTDSLPGAGLARRDMLVRVSLAGRVGLPARAALEAVLGDMAAHYALLDTVWDDLATEVALEDLDAIAESGALRVAADGMLDASRDTSLPEADRRLAEAALGRLYNLLREDDA